VLVVKTLDDRRLDLLDIRLADEAGVASWQRR